MKRSCAVFSRWIAAFGIGVLLAILVPSDWMLVVALVALIAVAIRCSVDC